MRRFRNRTRWPKYAAEYVITGGNHGGFGDYGIQDGDGIATITQEEQQKITAEKIADWKESKINQE